MEDDVIKIIVPFELNLEALPVGKLLNKQMFDRRGGTRRQDHASGRNDRKKRYKDHRRKIKFSEWKMFRACGRTK